MTSNHYASVRRRINFIESDDGARSAEKVCVRQTVGGDLEHSIEGPERFLPMTREDAEGWIEDISDLTDDEREFLIKCLCGEDWPGNY